jgi:putative ABC transport system permease protein
MNVFSRGVRNAFRNMIRTFSIIVILGLSIGLSLTMLVANHAVSDKITSVKASVGNTVTISPAGVRGFEGGGDPLAVIMAKALDRRHVPITVLKAATARQQSVLHRRSPSMAPLIRPI